MRHPLLRAALAAAALVVAAGCSTVIRGVVRDKPTGNPLAAVVISVGKDSATTNAIGAYELKTDDVEPSSVLLVNAPGYFMFSQSVARKGDEGRELVRDVELVPRAAITPRQ